MHSRAITDEEDMLDITDLTTENLAAEMERLTVLATNANEAIFLIWREFRRRKALGE